MENFKKDTIEKINSLTEKDLFFFVSNQNDETQYGAIGENRDISYILALTINELEPEMIASILYLVGNQNQEILSDVVDIIVKDK
jgi:hypothetical protein